MRLTILEMAAIEGDGGITCDEVELKLGFSHQTASARMSEMKRDGVLVPTERLRATRSGRNARVLVLARGV
jgi:hypothetical protein